MPQIPDIDIGIEEISIRAIPPVADIFSGAPPATPIQPPITVDIGLPIVDIPGCVETHESNNAKNGKLIEDDKRGMVTHCDNGIPSFNPIQYEPNRMIYTKPAVVDQKKEDKKEEVKSEETKAPKPPDSNTDIKCPTQKQLTEQPIGFIFDSGRKKVVGYKLEGTSCNRIVEDIPIPKQIVNAIPPAGTITTTASIAVVATTSALIAKPFADILLRVVKPVTKKVIKKIASIRGKKVKVLSTFERKCEQRDRNRAIMTLRSTLKPK